MQNQTPSGSRLRLALALVAARRRRRRPSRCAASCPKTARAPAGSSATAEARQGPEQVEKFTQSYKVGDGAALDLSHLSGDIRVTGGSGAEIKIEATKRVRHRDPEEAKRLLAALRIDVNNLNGRVEVRTIYPRRGSFGNNISASVDYVIAVPADATVSLKSISGDISVTSVKGEVRAETVSGDVNISAHAERRDRQDDLR